MGRFRIGLAAIMAIVCIGLPALALETEGEVFSALEEARAAFDAMPEDAARRSSLYTALGKEIDAELRAGGTDRAYSLLGELIARLDTGLSLAPSSGQYWRRYNAHFSQQDIEFRHLDYPEAALQTLRNAERDIRILFKANPDVVRYEEGLARTLAVLGWHTISTGDNSASIELYREAREHARSVLARSPDSGLARFALAYGLWSKAISTGAETGTYEAYERSLPVYSETIEAFKALLENNNTKGSALDLARVWYDYGQAYTELGDDDAAFKAYRVSFRTLKAVSDANPDDEILYRNVYLFAHGAGGQASLREGKIPWLEMTKQLFLEAEASGRLHVEDAGLIAVIDREIAFNIAMAAASGPEEIMAILDAQVRELEAAGFTVQAGTIEIDTDPDE